MQHCSVKAQVVRRLEQVALYHLNNHKVIGSPSFVGNY